MKEPFLKAIPLLTKIEDAGYEAYFVGGSVRDCLLGEEIADVDIATSATPQEIKAIFPKTVDVGIEHGTIVVLFNGTPYEVTTFRTESEYMDFRRPSEVQFIRSLREDLQRRDFTMNAIAMDKTGRFTDPFHGRQSIKEKIIKTVGKPEDRFNEDALRMMRAVRFYSQLGFEIETQTWDALVSSGYLLEKIAVERKLIEFEKLLMGKNRINALQSLADTGLYKFLPGMAPYLDGLHRSVQFNCCQLTVVEMWVFLIHVFGLERSEVEPFLKEWKLPIKKIKKIISILIGLDFRLKADWTASALFQAGIETAKGTERLYNVLQNQNANHELNHVSAMFEFLPIKQRSELQVTGTDLQEWFQMKPGPWIREKLEMAENAVITREISNRKESIREWLIRCNQS
ncbi:CCA tRNA nucleotidyltransferase [Bacillus sp. FJAT-29790]|uniref:CCA tRNA nucleotidyltransferase n=1 Tax=Bacillus sp. FJAT-29790 TaxID=1895002 RepID=UPI001C22603C|nr:CCA tRNA nucleotidyltransferase [Bacillus sp. FJAT-29790]MBU8879074.1 CCA tRNA nucleotidyltransferase [Bacillus sp. FJAT-29790]